MSKLIFYYSTMGSGKTMDLLRMAYNYDKNNRKILVMKPSIDTKAGDMIETRIGLRRKVDILIDKDAVIFNLISNQVKDVRCIFIDEAQFLTKEQVYHLFIVCKSLNIPVICYGLRTDFKGELFEGSAALIAYADELNEFKNNCSICDEMARFNARRVNGKYVTTGDKIVIDGTQDIEYVPLCGDCYLKEVQRIDYDKVKKYVKK